MARLWLRGACTLLLAIVCAVVPSSAASAAPTQFHPPKDFYLALGDSIAYGFQTAKAVAGLPPEAFDTGFVDVFSARLRQVRPDIRTVNFSCPGESTTSFTAPCVWKATGHALHDDYSGSQLAAALAFLAAHRGQVSPITLSLNGNDINAFLQSCPPGDLACVVAGAPAAIAQYRVRLTALLATLHAAAPDAEIILTGAYDPNVGAFAFADPLFQALNEAEAAAGATIGARFADPFPIFNPQGNVAAETVTICTLTLVCVARDSHPSDAGYRVLGGLVWDASGYDRLPA
jgi:lysophospholipase L1-like esterase